MADFLTEQLRERLKVATEGKPAGVDPIQAARDQTYIPGVDGFAKLRAMEEASQRKVADIQRKMEERNAAVKASQDSYVTQLGLDPEGVAGTAVNEAAMLAANVGEGLGTAADMAGISDGSARDFMRESLGRRVYRHDPNQDRGVLSDLAYEFTGTTYDVLGKSVEALGAVPKYIGDAITTPLMNAITGRNDKTPNLLRGAAEALQGMGASTKTNVSKAGVEAMEGFTPGGSLADPSSWTFGDDVTTRGVMMRGAQILGSLVPVVAASIATGGASAVTQSVVSGVAGGAQGGGAAISQARETIDKMASTRMPDGRLQIEAESETYRELIASGLSHEDAVKQTRDAAEKWAFALTAPVSALGGTLTNKILNPASKILDSRGILVQALGRGALGATEEGLQEVAEGIQTVSGVNQGAGTDLDPLEDSFGNLVLGALGGGPVGAVGGAVSGASNQVSKAATKTQEAPATSAEVRAAADEAKKTGDISALTDPKSKAYSPEQAIATLYELSKGKDVTPEAMQANLEKAGSVIADLETRRERVAAAIQSVSPEGIAAIQAELVDVNNQLASLPEDDPAREPLMTLKTSKEADLADAAKDPQAAKRMGVVLSRIDRQLEGAQKVLTTFQRESVPSDLNVDTELATVEGSTDPVAAQASVARVLSLAMAAPQRVSSEQVERLMALPDEVVNPAQKNYLRKLSDARVAANEARDLKDVSQEVMIGSKDNLGIAQYRKRIGTSLASGNRRSADRDLDLLSNFAADHEAKAIAYEAAYKEGRPIQMVKTKDGAWIESPVELTEEQLKRNGGNEISAESPKLIKAIRAEANALNTAAAELQAAVDLRFPTPSTQANQSTVATNDQDVSQAAVGTTPIEATATETTDAGSNVGGRPEGTEQGSKDQEGTATEQAEVGVASPDLRTETWNGMLVYLKIFDGLAKEEYRSNEFVPGRFEFAYITNQGQRITGTYEFNEFENWIDDFNITSDSGPHTIGRATLRKIITAIKEQHPTAGGLSGTRITGTRIKHNETPQDIHFEFKNGKLVALKPPSAEDTDPYKNAPLPWESDEEFTERRSERPEITQEAPLSPSIQSETTSVDTQGEVDAASVNAEADAVTDERSEVDTQREEVVAEQERLDQLDRALDSTTDVATEQASKEAGVLTTFSNPSPEGTPYQAKNLIAAYLTQRAGRPLVAIKNFLSSTTNFAAALGQDVLTDVQSNAIELLRQTATDVGEFLRNNLKLTNPAFRYTDPVQHLILETDTGLDLDENVKTAMTVAAFEYVARSGLKTLFNDHKAINAILHRPNDAEVSSAEEDLLTTVGTQEIVMINSLGEAVAQLLGLANKNGNTPVNLLPQLQAGMGTHLVAALVEAGILERTTLTGADLRKLNPDSPVADAAVLVFLRLVADVNGNPDGKSKEIFDAMRSSQSVISTLFGNEKAIAEPLFEVTDFNQQKVAGGTQGIPKELAEAQDAFQKTPFTLKKVHWNLLTKLPDDIVDTLAGVVKDTSGLQATRVKGIDVTNAGLMKSWDNLKYFVEELLAKTDDGLDSPFYFQPLVWVNQRVGILTSLIDPQTSKITRYVIGMSSWKTTVDQNNEASLNNFKLRVLEGFKVKTDSQVDAVSLDQFASVTGTPEVVAAVAAIRRGFTLDADSIFSAEDQAAIVAGVAKGKSKLHTFDALVALAMYEVAKDTDAASFEVQLFSEVDGKTNGPIFATLLMGGAYGLEDLTQIMEKGGIYTDESEHSQFNSWRSEPGNSDLYETSVTDLYEFMQSHINDMSEGAQQEAVDRINNVLFFTGDLMNETTNTVESDGRDMVKTPIQALNFGSTSVRAASSMGKSLVSGIYKKIEGLVAYPENLPQVVAALQGLGLPVPSKVTVNGLLNKVFGKADFEIMNEAFMRAFGWVAKDSIEFQFAAFLQSRDVLTRATNTSFAIYAAVHKTLRDQKMAQLIEAGEIAVNGRGQPIHDLSAAQLRELDKEMAGLYPVMHSWMSKNDGRLSTGLKMLDKAKSQSDKAMYLSEVKTQNGNYKARGLESTLTPPGVTLVSASIHSFDSGVSQRSSMAVPGVNLHDAKGVGLNETADAARALNKATWEGVVAYSPLEEVYAALSRSVLGLAQLIESGKVTPESAQAIWDAAVSAMPKDGDMVLTPNDFHSILTYTKVTAVRADKLKFTYLSNVKFIDQYPLEGGNYEVTEEDLAVVQKRLDAMSGQEALTEAEVAALEKIEAFLDSRQSLQKATGASTTADLNEEVVSPTVEKEIQPEPIPEATSFWGKLGTPDTKPDPQLEKFLIDNPKAGAKKLFSALTKIVESQPDSIRKTFNLTLIKQLASVLPANTEVLYITPNTPPSTLADTAPVDDWSGLYIPPFEGEAPKILIRSSDFKDSALNIYVLLHELTHAATAELIHGVEQGTVTDPAAIQLVRNLEALLEQVKATVGNDPRWQHHVTDIHELVAYGLSDPAFQKVLNTIQVPTKSKTNPYITGAKAFVRSLVNALFSKGTKTQKQIAESGLTHLITQTSGVMQAQKNLMKPAAKRKGPSLAMAAVQRLSTTELFDALADYRTDPEFAARQREVLGNIVEKLHGAFGSFKASLMQKAAASPMDAWLKALATDQAPFGNDLVAAPLRSTEQEMYVVDQVYAVMKTALDSKESQTVSAYRELAKLYTEARKELKGNPALTQEQYDYIFEVDSGPDGRSNYLARFAALALGHKQVSSLLAFDTARAERVSSQSGAPTSIGDRIQNLLVRVLEFFANKVNHTYAGQRADFKVQALVEHLVDIEAKRKLALSQKATNYMAPIEDVTQAMVEGGRAKAAAFLRSDFFTKSKQKIVRGGASMARVVLEDRGDEFMETVAKFRNKALGGKQGVIMSLVNEYKGPAAFLQGLLRGTKKLEKDRKDLMTNVSRTLMKAFKDGGSYLKLEDKESLTRVLVRTGAHTLLDHFTMDEIQGLVSNKASREKAIADFEGRLDATSGFKEHYIEQANVLGYFTVTGINRGQVFMSNVHNIARMIGTTHSTKISESSASKEEATINALVALYALGYTKAADSNRVAEVLRTENARTEGNNGVAFMLQSHKQFEADSMERLFKGRPTQMMHGYTPEIYNPHISLKLADAEEGAALKLQGYVGGAVLETDPLDTQSGTQHIYAIKGAGLAPYLTGIMSFRGMSAKGSEVLRNHGFKNKKELAALSQAKEKALDADAKRTAAQGRRDLSKAKGNNLAQVVDEQGNVTAYRYLMQESTKDNLLDRDNRFEVVMGALAGSIMDKETAYDQNTKLIQALRDQFDRDYTSNPGAYLTVSASSDDPEMREIWAMIPDNTKQDIREIWGSDEIQIRNEMLDMTFGYRKRSLAEAFQQDPAARSEIAKITTYVFEEAFRQYGKYRLGLTDKEAAEYVKRAGFAAARGERAWQEIVREIKDIIVVKSVVVLLGNIWSNFSYLYMSGMSLKEIARTHKIALTAATDYQRASDELASLEMQVASSYYPEDLGGEVEMRRRIIELKDAIAGNPVKDLIDAGLMPTIAEDVLLDDDPYSYKTQFAEWTNNKTKFLPDGAKKAVNFMYMGKSTSMYQGLSRMTQLSDFVARYAYYTHVTTRAKNPLSRMDAIQSASDAFVNYDIPMHRNVQYMDDMGLIMFSKYFMRIQKVLIKLARENPARVLSTLALGQIMDLGPIVLDSGMLGRIGNNPLEWGAFQYPGTLDELGTMQAVEGGLKLLK